MKQRQFSEDLPCELTQEELAGIASEMGRQRRTISENKAKKREAVERYKGLIDGAQARIDELADAAAAGSQIRPVVCTEVFDWDTNSVIVKRNDTGKTVRERPMTAEERQTEMWDAPSIRETRGKRATSGNEVDAVPEEKPIPQLPPAEHDREKPKKTRKGKK